MKQLLKKVGIFTAVFVIILLVDYILFTGLFSQIAGLDSLLNNFAISLVLFFLFFIGIPTGVAHYVTFKRYQKERTHTTVSDNRVGFTVVTSVILSVVFIFTFFNLAKPRFAPYSLQEVADEEFIIPTPTLTIYQPILIVSKKIGDIMYQLSKYQGNITLYQNEGRLKDDLPLNEDQIRDFWYDAQTFTLFVVENRGPDNGKQGWEQIAAYKIGGDAITMQTLSLHTTGLYEGTHILSYVPSQQTLLLETMGGDGCGGWGRVWMLKNTTSKVIQEVGGGCARPDLPRFVTLVGNELIFSKIRYVEETYKSIILELYSLDPFTNTSTSLLKSSDFPEEINRVKPSIDDPNILILSAGDYDAERTYELNIQTKKITVITNNSIPTPTQMYGR